MCMLGRCVQVFRVNMVLFIQIIIQFKQKCNKSKNRKFCFLFSSYPTVDGVELIVIVNMLKLTDNTVGSAVAQW